MSHHNKPDRPIDDAGEFWRLEKLVSERIALLRDRLPKDRAFSATFNRISTQLDHAADSRDWQRSCHLLKLLDAHVLDSALPSQT